MSSRHAPKPAAAKPTLKERAAVARDAAGRFIRRTGQAEAHAASSPIPELKAPLGKIRVPADAHPGTYGLRIDDSGLGRHAAPGASVIVEPTMPEGAGLAAFYLKGRSGPVIFDLTHHFNPAHAQPFAPGSEVTPLIAVCEPVSGVPRLIDADRVEKIHRVTGIYTPAEILDRWKAAPAKLPLMAACPEGMGEHYVKDTACYPTVRPGETVVYDPAQRELTSGALCVLEWSNGRRSLLMTNLRPSGGKGELRWWVDPVNRPVGREALERRLADNSPGDMLHTSDGPYTADHLRERIVGTVVGILAPQRISDRDETPETVRPGSRSASLPAPSQRSVWTMAALVDAGLTSKISSEIRSAIEDHANATEAGRAEPDDSDEAFDRIAAWQGASDQILRTAPVRSLADLRAKLMYLMPVMAPDMLDQTHVAHLEAICRDLDRLCREYPSSQGPSQPDRDWEEWAALHPGMMPSPQYCPTGLLALDFAIPREAAFLLGLAQAEFERRQSAYVGHPDPTLWPRVAAELRADMRMDALAEAAVPPRSKGVSWPDPVFAAIAALEQANAAMAAFDKAPFTTEGETESQTEDRLSDAQTAAYTMMLSTTPTSVAGLSALADSIKRQNELIIGENWRDVVRRDYFGCDCLSLITAIEALHGK